MSGELFETGGSEDKNFNAYFDSRGESAAEDPSAESASEAENEAAPQSHEPQQHEEHEEEQIVEIEEERQEGPEESAELAKYKQIEKNYKAALKSERIKRQEIEKQIRASAEEQQKMKDSFDQMLKQMQAPNVSHETVPSYDEDPIGHLKYQQEQLQNALSQSQQYMQQQAQHAQQVHQVQSVVNMYKAEAAEFAKETPDFQDAYKFLSDSMVNEYKAMGHSEQQAQQLLVQDELYLAEEAQRQGVNAGERVYALAKARGYSATPSAEGKLHGIKRGMQKSKSLGTASGYVDKNKVALSDIAQLNDDEFSRLWQQYERGDLNYR